MHSGIKVDSKLLTKACYTPATKARVKKSKHEIAEWTHIDGAIRDKLIITAPTHSTVLEGSGLLMGRFSVNAKQLHEALKRLEAIDPTCVLSFQDGLLTLHYGNTKISLSAETRKA
jgi:hypothetical protein